MAAKDTIERPIVTAQKAKTVGDENLPEPREVEVNVNKRSVDAQVMAEPEPAADKVFVHETSVALDEVITDPSSPLAVQVPDAGRGDLTLPIHSLDAPRPNDVFAEEAARSEDISEEDSARADAEGRRLTEVSAEKRATAKK